MKSYTVLTAIVLGGLLLSVQSADAQVVTYYAPTTTYYAPVPAPAPIPRVTYAYPTVVMRPVAPVATYSPPVPVTTYYAPAATTTLYAPTPVPAAANLVPVRTFYRGPVWVYDPTRILPSRRWRLVYP